MSGQSKSRSASWTRSSAITTSHLSSLVRRPSTVPISACSDFLQSRLNFGGWERVSCLYRWEATFDIDPKVSPIRNLTAPIMSLTLSKVHGWSCEWHHLRSHLQNPASTSETFAGSTWVSQTLLAVNGLEPSLHCLPAEVLAIPLCTYQSAHGYHSCAPFSLPFAILLVIAIVLILGHLLVDPTYASSPLRFVKL